MLVESSISEFLDQAASSNPTPGGGSVASLAGSLGVSLLSMVCNLTIGKEKYRDVEAEVRELLAQCEEVRTSLTALIEADVVAYGELNTALRLPRTTDEDKELRMAAVQKALLSATNVPLEIARKCRKGIELSAKVAEKGNRQAISDVGAGVLLCESALYAALLNVDINLKLLKDAVLAANITKAVEECTAGATERKNEIMAMVKSHMA